MQALLLSADLMMISAAQGTADRRGVTLVVHSNVQDAVESGAGPMELVFIDLRAPGLTVADAVERIRGSHPGARIVACGPHVHKQSLQAAAEAIIGCDQVITRGEFDRAVDGLFAALTASTDRE